LVKYLDYSDRTPILDLKGFPNQFRTGQFDALVWLRAFADEIACV